jgi:hypothetical protein
MLVYKPSKPGEKINEQWPLEPKWGYPKSKVVTEEVKYKEHGHIPICRPAMNDLKERFIAKAGASADFKTY